MLSAAPPPPRPAVRESSRSIFDEADTQAAAAELATPTLAELQLLRHALGEVPLVGFFAAGEIGHRHLYGYTGVLTVFTAPN